MRARPRKVGATMRFTCETEEVEVWQLVRVEDGNERRRELLRRRAGIQGEIDILEVADIQELKRELRKIDEELDGNSV